MKLISCIIVITVFLMNIHGSMHAMNESKTYDEMNLNQLEKKLQEKKSSLSGQFAGFFKTQKESIEKEIDQIKEAIEKKKSEEQTQKISLTGAAKAFKNKSSKLLEQQQKENPSLPKSQEIILENVQEIQKLVATDKNLFMMYKENENGLFKIKDILNKIDFESPSLPETQNPDEYPSWLKNVTPSFCDIATYKNTYAYGYFFKKSSNGIFETNMSVINFIDNTNINHPVLNVHKTAIQSLFVDDSFIVSHSQAGNIRFFSIEGVTSKDYKTENPEYKAKKLLAYNNKCMVVEEESLLSGVELYVKYIENNAEIEIKHKIGSYKKGEESPYLAAINETGNALIYNQHNRSLITCTKNSNKIIPMPYKNVRLPKQLKYRVAQQIHYAGNKAILVYDDQIYAIMLDKQSKLNEKLQAKSLFDNKKSIKEQVRSKAKEFIGREEPTLSLKTIVTTALQNNNTLWIITCKEPYEGNEEKEIKPEYVIQSIKIN